MIDQQAAQVTETPHIYHALDALRGVAAISVVLLHFGHSLHCDTLPHAYLAVDFFFVLSGFVVAHAYEAKLNRSMTPKAFMQRRFIRLYPLYVAGLILSVVTFVADVALGADHQKRSLEVAAFGLGLLFIPTPTALAPKGTWGNIFPTNGPAWSLSLEFWINAIYAFCSKRLTRPILTTILLLSLGAVIGGTLLHDDANLGWNWETYLGGWARVFWSFFAGIAAYRIHRSTTLRPCRTWVGVFLGLLLVDIFSFGEPGVLADLLSIVVLFPAIVFVGARVRFHRLAIAVSGWLGATSYALYIVHRPIGDILVWLYKRWSFPLEGETSVPSMILWIAVTVAVAYALDLADVRVRRFLTARFVR
jgi:peptidoglycan/LPS O-acetylase OafA/YrhL